jgi:hypothetical protein
MRIRKRRRTGLVSTRRQGDKTRDEGRYREQPRSIKGIVDEGGKRGEIRDTEDSGEADGRKSGMLQGRKSGVLQGRTTRKRERDENPKHTGQKSLTKNG